VTNADDSNLIVRTRRGLEFPSPLGLADTVSTNGRGVEGLLDSFGVSKHFLKGSVQVGPVCPDNQFAANQTEKQLSLRDDGSVSFKPFKQASFAQVAANLLSRQQQIVNGSLKCSSKNVVGVTLQANQETLDSIPYLAHLDFVKGIKELNELCDYVSIDLTHDLQSAGIVQYYKNPKAL
jgi:hypothetical protein